MRVQLGLSTSVLLGCFVFACGSDGSAPESPAQGPSPETALPDAPPPGDAPSPAVEKPPNELFHVLAGFDRFTGYLHPSSKRIFSLPTTIASSLARVTTAKIDGANVEVRTLAVKGSVPTGRIEAMTYEPASDRFILLVRVQRPPGIAIVSVALGGADATFASLLQVSPPPSETYRTLRARGGGVLVAQGGARVVKITISGTTATWGTPESAGGLLLWGNNTTYAYDAPNARLVALGRDWHDPATMQLEYRPAIGTASLDGPYVLDEQSFSLGPTALERGNPVTWSAWDAIGQRLFAAIQVKAMCGVSECVELETWSANLDSGTWTRIASDRRPPGGRTPFVIDDATRRAYSIDEGGLSALRLADPTPLERVPLTQDGDLGPLAPQTAIALSSGKILTSGRGFFLVLDPSAPSPRWERLAAKLPTNDEWQGSYAEDPATGDVFLFGGDAAGDPVLQVLKKDGSALGPIPTQTGPSGRTGHGSIFAGGGLVVAGGTPLFASGLLDDVWSFDRTDGTWMKLGSLPQPLVQVKLNAVSSSEVWALGYTLTGQFDLDQSPVVAIDLPSGRSRTLAAKGEKPPRLWAIAPLGSCFVGYESGEILDDTEPQLWRCEKDGDGVRWEKKAIDAHDEGLDRLAGAALPDGSRAYFVGQHIWRVDSKK